MSLDAPAGRVALSFDDGPDPTWTPRLLDALAGEGVRATFFVMGAAVLRWPEPVARAFAEGHDIQLHCHEHHRHTEIDEHDLRRDTGQALAALEELGVRPTRWRTPWGVLGPRTAAVAADLGLALTHWTADTEDWAGGPAAMLLDRVVPRLRPGAVVLAHDGLGPGALRPGCEETVTLVAPLVRAIRGAGLEPGPLLESEPLPAQGRRSTEALT